MHKQNMRAKRISIYISLKQELLSKDKVITLFNQPFKLKYIWTDSRLFYVISVGMEGQIFNFEISTLDSQSFVNFS